MASASSWLVWQLVDSAFPTGGFAHSGGLEAAWQLGAIRKGELSRWLVEALEHAASTALPIVMGVFDRPERFGELSALAEAMLTNHVANRASRAQGAALVATAAVAFRPSPPTPLPSGVGGTRAAGEIVRLRETARNSGDPMHLAPCFGFVTRALGVERDEAARLFVFQSMRALTSSAVRLGAVGPLEAQSLQAWLAPVAERCVARESHRPPEDAAQSSPLIELFQSQHDRLYSRLFSS